VAESWTSGPRLHRNNLRFTLNREPDNKSAREVLDKVTGQDLNSAYIATLEVETPINTFFRLTSPTVIAKLREASRFARAA
jgi:hydroxyacylglutathione hydrolase